MPNASAEYTFISWYRQGLANEIGVDATTGNGRASIDLEVTLNDETSLKAEQTARLYGPGDIQGINPKAIIRVSPLPGTTNFEPNYLPFIEFYDEDLPWRYSPGAVSEKLRPWLALLVFKESEFDYVGVTPGTLPYLQVKDTVPVDDFPSLEDGWAYAHVQVNTIDGTNVDNESTLTDSLSTILSTDPDAALSRIFSPRRLETNTAYTAFLVPAFETGRLGGLGEGFDNVPVMQASWPLPADDRRLPFYYQFSFYTDPQGDFETLAEMIVPKNTGELVVNTIDISDLNTEFASSGGGGGGGPQTGSPVDGALGKAAGISTKQLEIGSVLMPLNKTLPQWPGNNAVDQGIQNNLRERINKGLRQLNASESVNPDTIQSDPVVNQPEVYGRWAAQVDVLSATNPGWAEALNLDPRHRVVAALGAAVVRQNQDEFVDFAWDQVGAILEANQQIRLLNTAKKISQRLMKRHVEGEKEEDRRTPQEMLSLTANLHAKIKLQNGTDASISKAIKSSRVPRSLANTAFKKTVRPAGSIRRKLAKSIEADVSQEALLSQLDAGTVQAALPKARPYQYGSTIDDSITDVNGAESAIVQRLKQVEGTAGPTPEEALDLNETLSSNIKLAISPEKTISKRGLKKLRIPASMSAAPNEEELTPILEAPTIPFPLFNALKDYNQEFILPDVQGIPKNTVTLLEANRSFIEAFLLGANHEFARELLWREYPTDQRGTYFLRFWDKSDSGLDETDSGRADIREIHNWSGQLGENAPKGLTVSSVNLVLVLRADLFRKFPNTIIYAQRAAGAHALADDTDPENIALPVLKAELEPDVKIVGFHLTQKQVTAGQGWYFIFKERSAEVRFGLDAGGSGNSPQNWDELSWGMMAGKNYINLNQQISNSESSIQWGENAAHMAHILYQIPVAFGIHASDLLPPQTSA